MSRGRAAIWSTILSLPFVVLGAYLYLIPELNLKLPGTTVPASDLQLVGVPMMIFGIFIIVIGIYIQFTGPSEPSFREGETLVDTRIPSQRVAISQIAIGLPILGVAGYLLLFTRSPYLYPTLTFLVGLFFYSRGLKTYWVNTLTTYYVTTNRVISIYRFISLRRQEIPLNKIRGIEERKSILETIVGLGNIRIASGGGGGSVQLNIRNIEKSTSFADDIRTMTS